jgi:hypothetical protein
MRTCKKCGETKPLNEFEVLNKEKDWRRKECKTCVKKRVQSWTKKSKERIRKYHQEWYKQNRDVVIDRVNAWVKANPEKRKKNALAHYYRLQYETLMAYGGYKCACCGETEPMFLTIDHKNNDGAKHRKKIGSLGGARFYKWLRDHNYPSGFQVLCMNCNQGRHRNGGVCPHNNESVTTIPKGSRAKRPEAHTAQNGR